MSEEELAGALATVEEIDNETPDGVIVLTMMETEDKADNFFDQDEEVSGFDGTDGFAVWNLEQGGTYWVFSQMTAEDARPLSLSINDDVVVEEGICNDVTGSWLSDGLQWFHYGPFALEEGSLKVHTDGYWPHVKRFVLIPSESSRGAPSGDSQDYMDVLKEPTNKSDNVEVEGAMIVVDGDEGGFYEFEFINEVWAEQVYLDVVFASGDSRPMMLAINGETVEKAFCDKETGGYGEEDVETVRYGPYAVQSEVNAIKVTVEEGYFPHLGEIRVIKAVE